MRILVGIIHSNEPQFINCVNSVKSQEIKDSFDYFVISGFGKRDAHDKLYSKFMDSKNEFDIFIKLDADMVIQRHDFFKYIESLFTHNPILDWVQILIYDFFLKENISGLNIYSKNVNWDQNIDNMFTDRTLVSKTIRKYIQIEPEIKWVVHCDNGTLFQAFNFGFHRAIKIFQYDRNKIQNSGVSWWAFTRIMKQNKDRTNLMILSSLIYVYKNKLGSNCINNDCIEKKTAFNYLDNFSNNDLYLYFNSSKLRYFLYLGNYGYKIIFISLTIQKAIENLFKTLKL